MFNFSLPVQIRTAYGVPKLDKNLRRYTNTKFIIGRIVHLAQYV